LNHVALFKSWYKQFPAMACRPGCLDCCRGYAPAMSKWEWDQIRHPGKIATASVRDCPFITEAGCAIYARRPIICRMFGTVDKEELKNHEIADTLTLACPHGCQPEVPLPARAALEILIVYQRVVWKEFAQHLGQWLAYLTPGTWGAPVPDKFQWLRYVMATPEGKRKVCMDVLHLPMVPGPAGSWEVMMPRTSHEEANKLKNVLQY
jgi:Fe-S-cluster containining protein